MPYTAKTASADKQEIDMANHVDSVVGQVMDNYKSRPGRKREDHPLPFSLDHHEQEMGRLWIAMGERYGNQWTSGYGDLPNEEWTKACSKITPSQIQAGLDLCVERTNHWPPNLSEFVQLCCSQPASKKFEFPQLSDQSDTRASPEVKAYIDCKRVLSLGDTGFIELYNERVEFHTAEMGQ